MWGCRALLATECHLTNICEHRPHIQTLCIKYSHRNKPFVSHQSYCIFLAVFSSLIWIISGCLLALHILIYNICLLGAEFPTGSRLVAAYIVRYYILELSPSRSDVTCFLHSSPKNTNYVS